MIQHLWKRLVCKHEWNRQIESNGTMNVKFHNQPEYVLNLPDRIYFQCTKCGKVKV